jgi:hypothetical protein
MRRSIRSFDAETSLGYFVLFTMAGLIACAIAFPHLF